MPLALNRIQTYAHVDKRVQTECACLYFYAIVILARLLFASRHSTPRQKSLFILIFAAAILISSLQIFLRLWNPRPAERPNVHDLLSEWPMFQCYVGIMTDKRVGFRLAYYPIVVLFTVKGVGARTCRALHIYIYIYILQLRVLIMYPCRCLSNPSDKRAYLITYIHTYIHTYIRTSSYGYVCPAP